MKLTENKLLSDCGTCLVLNDGVEKPSDRYEIKITEGDNLLIEVGAKVGTAVAKFTHPNIFHTDKRVYGFKHYRANGSKFWTEWAGISHFLIIPKNKIYLLPKEGYSYIKAEINGVEVSFNVSGGGGSNGWTDYLGKSVCISVGHKLLDVKKLVEVAIRNPELEKDIQFRELEKWELEKWEKMNGKASPKIHKQREQLYKMIEEKKPIIIILNEGYTEKEGIAKEVIRKGTWVNIGNNRRTLDYTKGRVQTIHVNFSSFGCHRVKISQVDWVKTCQANFP